MSNALIPLLLDVLVLVFLGMTIVYVARLFKSLNDFKRQRKEFETVMNNLTSGVDQAERSISALKDISAKEAAELEELIRRSQAMSDELKIINEAGESMAKRLERLAETNRELVQSTQAGGKGGDKISSPVPHRKKDYSNTLKNVSRAEAAAQEADLPKFMIKDRDTKQQTPQEDLKPEALQSQAEKELFDALKGNSRRVSGGGQE